MLRGEQNIWEESIDGFKIKIERMLSPSCWVYYAKPIEPGREPWYVASSDLDRLRDLVRKHLG